MPWMSDEQYELMQDTRDKAITARSAHSTRTHCGKSDKVRFPSDNLTKKEREAMNSECKSYRLNDPMTYDEFKAMPDDLKEIYLNAIIKKYNTPLTFISTAMGMDTSTLSWLIRARKLKVNSKPNRGRTAWDKDGFYNWWNGVKVEPKVETKEELKYVPINELFKKESTPEPSDDLVAVNEEAEIQAYVENDISTTENVANYFHTVNYDNDDGSKEYSAKPTICTNPYHHIPVIPKSGSMIFNNNRAEDALVTMKALLQDARVNITITWSMVEDSSVPMSPDVYEDILKKQATTVNYALLNAQRKEELHTKG